MRVALVRNGVVENLIEIATDAPWSPPEGVAFYLVPDAVAAPVNVGEEAPALDQLGEEQIEAWASAAVALQAAMSSSRS